MENNNLKKTLKILNYLIIIAFIIFEIGLLYTTLPLSNKSIKIIKYSTLFLIYMMEKIIYSDERPSIAWGITLMSIYDFMLLFGNLHIAFTFISNLSIILLLVSSLLDNFKVDFSNCLLAISYLLFVIIFITQLFYIAKKHQPSNYTEEEIEDFDYQPDRRP